MRWREAPCLSRPSTLGKHGNEYSKQTWAAGLDEAGRPIVLPGTDPTYEGNLVWPSLQGATNWFSPSYNPDTEQFFVATRLMGAVYYKADVEYEEGQPFLGGGEQALSAAKKTCARTTTGPRC